MEDEIVSLICPLGLSRIIHPAKGFECLHRQCFDLETFIKFHEHSINLCCTICNKELNYKDLQIDGIFILALQQYPNDIRCIVKPDGTTSAIIATSNVDVVDVSIEDAEYTCSKYNNSIILVDDDEDSDTNTSNTSNNVYYYSKKRVLDKLHVSKDRHIRSFYHKRYRSTSFSDTQPNSNTDVIIID
ncbi:hypothetical protein BDF19DRAFT_187594 [Syncephalis fuscata]|nr:hypothetical protein BDF19DRAFT_187594 [Syncephalis fuscata]